MPKYVTDEELELFNSYDVVETDGTINYDNYQNWFKNYVNTRLKANNKLMQVTEVIEKANNISMNVIKDKPKTDKEEIPLVNGMLDKEELISFIVDKVDVESLKSDTKAMVKEILADDNKEEAPADNNEKIEAIKPLVQPLLKKVKFDENIPKNLEEDLVKFFKDEGLKPEEIEKLLEPIKDDDNSSCDKKKEKPYNPYSDWKYIYYMWTLGHDYSRFLFAKPKQLGESKLFAFKEEHNEGQPGKEIKKKKINKAYEKEYYILNSELGLNVNIEELTSDLAKEDKKEFFTEFVKKSYSKVKDNVKDIVVFTNRLNDLCTSVAKTLDGVEYEPFGGLDNNEIRNLLIGLKETDCNITNKVKQEFVSVFGNNYLKADPIRLAKYADSQFNILTFDAETKSGKYQDSMAEAIATYKFLKDVHNARTIGFRLFSKANYDKEREVLNGMEAVLNRSLAPEKRAFIEKTLKEDVIYKKGYKEELEKINDFSLDLASDSYEIVESDKEQITVEINPESENEVINNDTPTVDLEVVEENNSL